MQQTLEILSSNNISATQDSVGHSFTTFEREFVDLSPTILGWGSDLEPGTRPGVPMDPMPQLGVETLYPDFEQQIPKGRVHKSVEHAKLTPVFGNACPPRGLSGLIRDLAYRYSEGQIRHWLMLVLADRVDVVEELLIDCAHLRIPNIPKEMGIRAELKYNKKGFAKKMAVAGISVGALVWLYHRRRQRAAAQV